MSTCVSTLDRFVTLAGELYSLPAVAVEVLELTNDPRVDARQLKECIENDPALTTKILRVVNSSLFGLSQQVSDLNQALALLGMKPLKLLVLGFSLPDALFAEVAGEVLGRYWQHTLVKAVAAREISETLWKMPGDEAFIAGLLQDLGLLVLVQHVGEPYVRFVNKVAGEGGDLQALERAALGFDHTELTARLLAHWKLPETVVQGVWLDTSRPGGLHPTARALAQILRLAELVATLFSDRQMHRLAELLAADEDQPQLSAAALAALVGELQGRVEHLADVLSLELPPGLNYRDILDQAHQQMVGVAAEVVGDLVAQNRKTAAGERHLSRPHIEARVETESRLLSSAIDRVLLQPAARTATSAAASAPLVAAPGRRAASASAGPTAAAVTETREREDDVALFSHLRVTVAACRQHRCPLSLLLVEVEHYEDVVFSQGLEGAEQLLERLSWECRRIDQAGAISIQTREARFAIILPNCERRAAVEHGNQLLRRVRRFTRSTVGDSKPALMISIGAASVALPLKNFPVDELVQSADRCLYGVQASGGDALKSIEIY